MRKKPIFNKWKNVYIVDFLKIVYVGTLAAVVPNYFHQAEFYTLIQILFSFKVIKVSIIIFTQMRSS